MTIDATELSHRAAISAVILAYARALDQRDWVLLRSILEDEVDTDFTEAMGQPPAKLRAEQVVQSLQHLLGTEGLKTQHLSTNHTHQIAEKEAASTSYYIAQHFLPNATGEKSFNVHGYYTWGMRFSSNQWRISSIKIHVSWSTGTPSMLNL